LVVGKSGERALSRVLLRNVESGAWRVERDREFASLRSGRIHPPGELDKEVEGSKLRRRGE